MPCLTAPPLPVHHASHADKRDAKPARRRCGAKTASTLANSPSRGLAIITSLAATLALTVAMLQLAGGHSGTTAAQTLYLAAGFNILFTTLYAPLLALFTLRTGFLKAIGALVATLATGLAYALGLLFISTVLLVAMAGIFG